MHEDLRSARDVFDTITPSGGPHPSTNQHADNHLPGQYKESASSGMSGSVELGRSVLQPAQHPARNGLEFLGVVRLTPGGDCPGEREGGEFGSDRRGGFVDAA